MLKHMKRKGLDKVVPKVKESETHLEPIIDFKSGYVLRALDKFPKQGEKAPWKLHQNYLLDSISLRFGSVDDGVVEYSKAA
jgi:poly-gamma-glutamate capsule biosynthesis protein CapA/YwtB (metallophosphatase superfamily)